jgi:hypothetical protein
MPNLRAIVLHVGVLGTPVGDPERLLDKYPSVQRASFCFTDHLMWHLGSKVDLRGVSKLILRTDPNVESLEQSAVEDMVSVKLLRIPFDLEAASELEGVELKKKILDSTTEALIWLAKREGWTDDHSVMRQTKCVVKTINLDSISREESLGNHPVR